MNIETLISTFTFSYRKNYIQQTNSTNSDLFIPRFLRAADNLGQHFVVIWRGLPMHVQIPAGDERLATAASRVPKWDVVVTPMLVHAGREY